MEIAATGRMDRLVISGKATADECLQAWEEIIRLNSRALGDYQYDSYFQLLKGYALLIAEYTIVKSSFISLALEIEWERIVEVRKRGYVVDTSNNEMYCKSIVAGLRRVDNLITKATMKRNELEKEFGGNGKLVQPVTYQAVLASLNVSLGFCVNENLTLSAFNEYKKIIKEKNRQIILRTNG